MENYWSFSGRVKFLCVFLLVCCANAENMTEPRRNVNLSPIWGWRSAFECMLNVSNACLKKGYKLSLDGVLNVNQTQVTDFCEGGCAQHTKDVLKCIHEVKRDFWFANKATVDVLQDAISSGCASSTGISTVDYSGGVKMYQKMYTSFISAATAAFLIMFNL